MVNRVGALIEHGGENLIRVAVGCEQLERVGFIYRDGFFDQHMQAGLERGDPHRRMRVVRRADEHGVDISRLHKLREVREKWNLRESCGSVCVLVTDRRQRASRHLAIEDGTRMGDSHQTKAHDGQPDFSGFFHQVRTIF